MLETHSILLRSHLKGRPTKDADSTRTTFSRTDMYQAKNNRRHARQLAAHVCARPAIIVDLCDAAAFIDMHGNRTQIWVAAATAVKCADHNLLMRSDHRNSQKRAAQRRGA
jgi:hypothetical protein